MLCFQIGWTPLVPEKNGGSYKLLVKTSIKLHLGVYLVFQRLWYPNEKHVGSQVSAPVVYSCLSPLILKINPLDNFELSQISSKWSLFGYFAISAKVVGSREPIPNSQVLKYVICNWFFSPRVSPGFPSVTCCRLLVLVFHPLHFVECQSWFSICYM